MLLFNDSLSSAEEELKGKAVSVSRIVEGLDRAQEIRRVINALLIRTSVHTHVLRIVR